MKIFKLAFKLCRKESSEIFKGFGFKHLSDATQFYVHQDNESYRGTTTLCQTIGESVGFFSTIYSSIINQTENQKPFGDYYFDERKNQFYFSCKIPPEYIENKIIDKKADCCKVFLSGNNIKIAILDKDEKFILSSMEDLSELYKLLFAFCVLLCREVERNTSYKEFFDRFLENPEPETFVNLCEDFYQFHKNDDYQLEYDNFETPDFSRFISFADSYKIILENKKSLQEETKYDIIKFSDDKFSFEQKKFIPHLSSEFILPSTLSSVCNAITNGDVLTTLFHGPAGTGKTMSCKLVCQAINLPIMETINCTENLDEFVLGKFIPEGEKIIFKESFVTKAIREGGAVVFEEINFAKPQYLAFLNSLLDDNGFVHLDNGEVVQRHKNFRFFATMNIGYFGTKELNQALYNRFNCVIEVAALSDESIKRMLIARVPECSDVVDKMISVYHKIQKKIEAEDLDVVLSPRNLENWARVSKYEGFINAAEKTIIPIAKCDRVLEKTIRNILQIYKWK